MLSGKPVNSSAKMTSTVYVLIDTYEYYIECYVEWVSVIFPINLQNPSNLLRGRFRNNGDNKFKEHFMQSYLTTCS